MALPSRFQRLRGRLVWCRNLLLCLPILMIRHELAVRGHMWVDQICNRVEERDADELEEAELRLGDVGVPLAIAQGADRHAH